jgi:hypothetical protein
MEKKGVLQLALQLNFSLTLNTCNSSYLYVISVIRQVAKVTRIAIHCIYGATHYNSLQPIATLLQQRLFNYYATPL